MYAAQLLLSVYLYFYDLSTKDSIDSAINLMETSKNN